MVKDIETLREEGRRALLKKGFAEMRETGVLNSRLRHRYFVLSDVATHERFSPVRPLVLPGLVNHWGHKSSEESGTEYWLFEGVDENAVLDALSTITDVGGWRPNVSYDCSGQSIGSNVYVRVVGPNRILASQWTGYDV